MTEKHEDTLARSSRAGEVGTEPVAAASVVPIRDGARGLEVLMLRRNSNVAFGGMWVFPGGRVDAADAAASSDEVERARLAATREALEEANLTFSPHTLLPFSHWTPPESAPRRFLTWFFVAPAAEMEVRVDGEEIREHEWIRPLAALRRRDAGEIELAPPTFVTLFELMGWPSVAVAMEAIGKRTPEHYVTRIVVDDCGPYALWHGDAGYDKGDPACRGPRHRLLMHKTGWRYERTG